MSDRWQVVTAPVGRTRRVPYGPCGDTLPARFRGTVNYAARPVRVRLTAAFDGAERVRVESVSVERTDGNSVTPQDMARLQLAQVVGTCCFDATKHGPGVVAAGGRKRSGPPSDDELRVLARMYWFEYVSWGSPRRAVMSRFELPRSTANYWIRRAGELYGLPGPHSEET